MTDPATVAALEQDEETLATLDASLGELILPRAYIPVGPTAKQEWFLMQDAEECFVGGSVGGGKMLNLSTRVPTPLGWSTIGDLQIGDEVFGADGTPCRVEWLSPIDLRAASYRLVLDDGSEFEACSDHLWLTFDARELEALTRRNPEWRARRRKRRVSRAVAAPLNHASSLMLKERNATANPAVTLPAPVGTVRTTREIASTLKTARGHTNHAIPVVSGPLELPEADLLLDPYVFGAWLGDGNTDTGQITSADPEVIAQIEQAGFEVRRVPSAPYGWRIVGLTSRLRELGLLGEKRVPDTYLRGSIEQRIALLQGLMDTDGSIAEDGRVEFSVVVERLAKAVHELACSLGQKPTILKGRAKLYGRDCGPRWRVCWMPTLPVFRLPRKLARQPATTRRTNLFRYVKSCDPIPARPMRCIRVSHPSGLFLVGDAMVPTHNSWSLLMAALQFADRPDYSALLLRPTLTEFFIPDGLHEVAQDWLGRSRAAWIGGPLPQWRFPSGATLTYGYLASINDVDRYKGGAFAYIGFDELVGFTLREYLGMLRVLRSDRDALPGVPMRVRSASNPSTSPRTMPNQAWIKQRFINPATRPAGVVFVPSGLDDNPHIDREEYIARLQHMLPADRERLIHGNWDIMEEGALFRREWIRPVPASRVDTPVKAVRYWDLAATEVSAQNPDPDWTVGLRLEVDRAGTFTIRDIVRGRFAAHVVEQVVQQTAAADTRTVPVYIEQEGGASGKQMIAHFQRRVLQGYVCHGVRPSGDKLLRARPVAAAAGNGLVQIVDGCPNTLEFLDEIGGFGEGSRHDDMCDALSGSHTVLTKTSAGAGRTSVPRGRIPGVDPRPRIPAPERRRVA